MDIQESKREKVAKGFIGLLIGIALTGAGIWTSRQLHIVWSIWPSTDGVVMRSTLQETLHVPSAKGGMPYHRYSPKVEFRYSVGGQTYTTEANSVYSAGSVREATENLVALYAPGTHHPVRYNPRDPRDIRFGVIEFGPLALSFLLLVLGVMLTTVGTRAVISGALQAVAPAEVAGPSRAKVLPFAEPPRAQPAEGTVVCPGCGRRVKASEDNCPNCLKSLRAA